MLTVTTRIRVEWGHCDPARIIFNPNYYIWMDQGAHSLLREGGLNLPEEIRKPGFRGTPLVTSSAEFYSPAYYGDVLTLDSRVQKFGNTSFVVEHHFSRDGEPLCSGTEVRVWGGSDKAEPEKLIAVKVPEWIRENLSQSRTIDASV